MAMGLVHEQFQTLECFFFIYSIQTRGLISIFQSHVPTSVGENILSSVNAVIDFVFVIFIIRVDFH